MIKTITQNDFIQAFDTMNRSDHFSIDGHCCQLNTLQQPQKSTIKLVLA